MTEQPLREGEGPRHNEGSCDLCTGHHDSEEAAFMNRKAEARATAGAVEPPCPHHRVEWAVVSDDGSTYEVEGRTREKAEYEAALLREPDEDGHSEPGAHVAMRRVCTWVNDLSGGAAGAVEGADPDRIRALLDRWATDDPEEQARTLAILRATTPEAPASPPPLDVERMAAALHANAGARYSHLNPAHPELHEGVRCWCFHQAEAILAALASAAPSEPGEPEA